MKFRSIKTQGFAVTRERLGLSQSQLAEQLGVAKSTISMAETGKRSLPVKALLRFAELEIKLAATNVLESAPGTTETLTKHHSADMSRLRELQCDVQVQKLNLKLEAMTARFQKLQMQLQMVDHMMNQLTDEKFILYMQIHRDRLIDQVKTCNPPQQMLLRNKIAVLSAELCMNRAVRQQFS